MGPRLDRGRHLRTLASRAALLVVLLASNAHAQRDANAASDATAAQTPPDASPLDVSPVTPATSPGVSALRDRAAQVRALMAGQLALDATPQSLFDVDLSDDEAIAVEIQRLSRIAAFDRSISSDLDASSPPDDADASGQEVPAVPQESARYQARAALDQARLAFYELPRAQRERVVQAHLARRSSSQQTALQEAQRRQREADLARQQAIESASRARNEADRLVAEERARLFALSSAQAAFETSLARQRTALEARADVTLRLRRQVRELSGDPERTVEQADSLYNEVRTALRSTRTDLASALVMTSSDHSDVPRIPDDRLENLTLELDLTEVTAQRAALIEANAVLRRSEQALRQRRARQLYENARTLNADRLTLLGMLSSTQRADITGFGPSGLNQALAELRQVTLVLRYHSHEGMRWIRGDRGDTSAQGRSALALSVVGFQWVLTVFGFLWLRRASTGLLARWRESVQRERRKSRTYGSSGTDAGLQLLQQIHKPLEWFVLALLLHWMLPLDTQNTLEVQLLAAIAMWTLGGNVAVSFVNAFAAFDETRRTLAHDDPHHALRLRSLRLVSRSVVSVALFLRCTNLLVGEGTIYRWAFFLCWFAAIPLIALIIHWWRPEIFQRVTAVRKKKLLHRWVSANQTGALSIPAALVGGVYLFGTGISRFVRAFVGRFDLTRRVLAYFFRRGLDRIAEERPELTYSMLAQAQFDSLGPEVRSAQRVATEHDEALTKLRARIAKGEGAVIALVGERGMGKSHSLDWLAKDSANTRMVRAETCGMASLLSAYAHAKGADAVTEETDIETLLHPAGVSAVLIDDVQRIVRPMMGGLKDFDRLIAVARANAKDTVWVLAMDEIVWRFLLQSRGARPMFDDVIMLSPWSEETIAELLEERSTQAEVQYGVDLLLENLPKDSDETDRAEARDRARLGYFRLLWDYANGNPGVALHMWRRSIGVSTDGDVSVKPFRAPDTKALESLPDQSLFVLRAVLQLEIAHPDDIARSTLLSTTHIDDALRFGLNHGFFRQIGDRYRVTWGWFRAITRFLQRRYLLPMSS